MPKSDVPEQPARIFDVVRRGYDCGQVDQHLETVMATLADQQRAYRDQRERADQVERELGETRARLEQRPAGSGPAGPGPAGSGERESGPGFGYRVERLLRAAEQEAAEVRSAATREATALLEHAHEDAERHRHEVEQSLISRTATLEQDAARRRVELDERERELNVRAAAAEEQTKRVLSEVSAQAEALRADAAARAEQERIKVEQVIRDRRESAERELARLRTLHDEVRGQLARLLDSLAGEFEGAPRPRPTPKPRPPQRPGPVGGRQPMWTHGQPPGTPQLAPTAAQNPSWTDPKLARPATGPAASGPLPTTPPGGAKPAAEQEQKDSA